MDGVLCTSHATLTVEIIIRCQSFDTKSRVNFLKAIQVFLVKICLVPAAPRSPVFQEHSKITIDT
jgi:hypothetical protein